MDGTTVTWRRCAFRLDMGKDHPAEVDGIVLDTPTVTPCPVIGIHFGTTHSVDVTHVPSGLRIAGFTSLGAAMEFAVRVAYLVDWTVAEPMISDGAATAIENVRRILEATSFRPRNL